MPQPDVTSRKRGLADYLAIPEESGRYEILNGALYPSPSPGTRHQGLVGRLGVALFRHFADEKDDIVLMGPIDVVLGPHDIVVPDVILVLAGHTSIIGEERINGAPDLVVEIISKSSVTRDREIKPARYAMAGVPHFWLVDPEAKRIDVFELNDGAYRSSQVVTAPGRFVPVAFPGLELDLAQVFA